MAERFRQVEENDRTQDTKIEDLQIEQAHLRAELKEQRMSDIAVAIIICVFLVGLIAVAIAGILVHYRKSVR